MRPSSNHIVQVGDGRCIRCGETMNTSAQTLCPACLGSYAEAVRDELIARQAPQPPQVTAA